MKFYKYLYVDDSTKKNIHKVKWRLKFGKLQYQIYVVMLSQSDNLFDIIESTFLKQSYYKRQKKIIVGIAKGRDAAFELVRKILDDSNSSGNLSEIKNIIRNNQLL